MVIDVKEGERSLSENQEDGVSKLNKLGEDEKRHPHSSVVVRKWIDQTHTVDEAAFNELVQQSGRSELNESDDAEDGQTRVPHDQKDFQSDGLSFAHPSL